MEKYENLDYTGWARRIDLSLREKHPLLKTSIFKISNLEFAIVIQNKVSDFISLEKEFDYSIRYATAPVRLLEKSPEKYKQIIPNISDSEIPIMDPEI